MKAAHFINCQRSRFASQLNSASQPIDDPKRMVSRLFGPSKSNLEMQPRLLKAAIKWL